MSSLLLDKKGVKFIGNKGEQILLNTTEFLHNKSRIPMHSLVEEVNTIPKFLAEMYEKNKKLFLNDNSVKEIIYGMIDALVASKLITTSAPMKVAEFGSTIGDISYNLTEVMGKMNPKSLLCLISNIIGNESANECLDCITQAESCSELSMVYSDYFSTNIKDENFDIVVINGDVCFDDHYDVIKEVERVTKKNGFIICWTSGDYLLESTFKLIFSELGIEEYEITPQYKILTVTKTDIGWSCCVSDCSYDGLIGMIEELREKLDSNEIDTYRPYVKQLNKYINVAIEKYDIQCKVELIELKETLIYYMINLSTEHKEFYCAKLKDLLDLFITAIEKV